MAANGITSMGDVPHLAGPPALVADALRPYVDLGFRTIIVRMPAPYDHETIDRMGEVAALLDAMRVVILAGGTGGAKLAAGLQAVLPPGDLTVVANTGDDTERHGLLVMPDHDAVLYMLVRSLRLRARLGRDRRDVDGHGRPGRVRRGGLVPPR